MTPDIIPVLVVFGTGAALGVAGAWLAGLVRRALRWRSLCQPPPVPQMPAWTARGHAHRGARSDGDARDMNAEILLRLQQTQEARKREAENDLR